VSEQIPSLKKKKVCYEILYRVSDSKLCKCYSSIKQIKLKNYGLPSLAQGLHRVTAHCIVRWIH